MIKNLIVILGATASGKTKLATRLALELKGEIISADSRQVYKGMDIGTGKDLKEYVVDGHYITYHMIDIISAKGEFNLYEFQNKFYEIYLHLTEKKIIPIVVGGTGLYLEAIIAGYQLPPAPPDEELRRSLQTRSVEELREVLLACGRALHNKTDLADRDRLIRAIEIEKARGKRTGGKFNGLKINAAVFGIHWERELLRKRITERLKQRLEQGMIDEVAELRKSGLTWARLESFGLEYRYIARYLQGKNSYEDMFAKLNTGIHQFAKRQETWFRRMERKGIEIEWIIGDDYKLLKESVNRYFK
jgi:tRNA dimethylallyltransferase